MVQIQEVKTFNIATLNHILETKTIPRQLVTYYCTKAVDEKKCMSYKYIIFFIHN